LIFQCFPNHSGTDTLKNTLTSKIRYCRFVAAGMDDTSPLARTCHPILLGDNAFISAQQQSKRSDEFKDTPIFSAALSPCHPVINAISGPLQRQRRDNGLSPISQPFLP
jgi:hypothetical protein